MEHSLLPQPTNKPQQLQLRSSIGLPCSLPRCRAVFETERSDFRCQAVSGPRNSDVASQSATPIRKRSVVKTNAQAASTTIDSSHIQDNFCESNAENTVFRTINTVFNSGVLGVGVVACGATLFTSGTSPWELYSQTVTANPLETKALISGVVYFLGDLIAQSYEGRSIADWDRGRALRSAACGCIAHGPLSHLYYVGLDHACAQQSVIPLDSLSLPLLKIGIDQTVWSLFWNSTYFALLGILKAESPVTIVNSVQESWFDLLKAGWRIWPLVHLLTYSVVPLQHRLLFVDGVELAWVAILSAYGQQQSKSREEANKTILEATQPHDEPAVAMPEILEPADVLTGR